MFELIVNPRICEYIKNALFYYINVQSKRIQKRCDFIF